MEFLSALVVTSMHYCSPDLWLQLYDLDKEVAMEAIDILDEACDQEVRAGHLIRVINTHHLM